MLSCCGSFGDCKPEIHGIAVPLALGNGLPDMVLSAAGPAISRSAASYLAEVRPRLIDAVQQIRGHWGAEQRLGAQLGSAARLAVALLRCTIPA